MSARRRPSRVLGTLGTPKLTPVPEDLRGVLVAFGETCPTCGDAGPKDFLTMPARQAVVRCGGCGHRLLGVLRGQG